MRFLMSIIISSIFCFGINAQKVITNPDKPINQRSGRVIIPQKIMEITGDSDEFFLKWPSNIKIGKEGNIFLEDQKQLLKFTPGGKFIVNYYKNGLGPGEVVSISNFFPLEDDSIVIHNQAPNKIVTFDSKGKLTSELRLPFDKYFYFIFLDKENYYFYEMMPPQTKGAAKVADVNYQLIAISRLNSSSLLEKVILPVKSYLYNSPGAYIMVKLVTLSYQHLTHKLFYFSHTPEYNIKLVDLEKNEIISEITRQYEHIPVTDKNKNFVNSGRFSLKGKFYESPIPDYLNDIQSLHVVNKKLWVITSTTEKDKGVLVDVCDESGKYVDCFFLKFPNDDTWLRLGQGKIEINGDALFVIEQDKDENWMISKYKIKI